MGYKVRPFTKNSNNEPFGEVTGFTAFPVLRLSLFPMLAEKSGVQGVVIVIFLFCKTEMSLLTPKYCHEDDLREDDFKRRNWGGGSVLPNGVGK